MIKPNDVIKDIRTSVFRLDEKGEPTPGFEALLEMLNGMAEHLSEGLYEKSDHFIFELIQNAEDNDYATGDIPALKFELIEDDPTKTDGAKGCLCIYNNETGFEEKHVKALSGFAKSTKKGKKNSGFIGEKGIGFKSVFTVTNSPHIFSNGYRFKFLRNDSVATIGFVVPYWLDHELEVVKNNGAFETSILLPLKDDSYEYIKNQLEVFNPETILFLKKLKKLEIITTDTEKIIECVENNSVITLSHIINDEISEKSFWIESDSFKVPDNLLEEKRENVTEREITVAFPLNGATGEERVFSYLPTEELPGFPFYLNADFLLPASRENIFKRSKWNNWLIGNIGEVVANGILAMIGDNRVGTDAYQYIPLPGDISYGSKIFEKICSDVQSILGVSSSVITDDGSLQQPGVCRYVSNDLRMLLAGNKPDYFNELYLIDESLDKVLERVRFIGVEVIPIPELREIFEESKWVLKHSVDWFVQVYLYLIQKFSRNNEFRKFNIIPSENDELISADNAFLTIDKKKDALLSKTPDKYREKIKFISKKVLKAIKENEEKDKVLRKLSMRVFSISSFIENVLIEEINKEIDGLNVVEFKQIVEFVLTSWKELEKEDSTGIVKEFPLLLVGKKIVGAGNYSDKELVVPEQWDKKTGWQLIFKSRIDKSRFDILDNYYTKFDRADVKKYFSLIGATETPSAQQISVKSGLNEDLVSNEYFNLIDKDFLSNYAIENTWGRPDKTVQTWLPPSVLLTNVPPRNKTRDALVHWVNRVFRKDYSFRRYFYHAQGSSFYRKPNTTNITSAIYYALTTIDWVKTTNGYHRPGQVFLKDKTLERIFVNRLPFLEDKFTDTVIELLGINQGATEETLVNFLSDIKLDTEVPKATLVSIYEYLSEYCEDYTDYFSYQSLIYVPQDGGKWLTSSEVIWEDADLVIGNAFGWLSTYYPDKLKEFFTKELGVKNSIDDEAYVSAWLRIQNDDPVETDKVEDFLSVVIPKIVRSLTHEIESDWVTKFITEAEVWTQDKCWQSTNNVYVPDDRRLRTLFKDSLYYVWLPEKKTHVSLEPLYSALSIKKMSQQAEYSIVIPETSNKREKKQFLTEHTLRLLCLALINLDKDDRGDFTRCFDDGLLQVLFNSEEVEVSDLVVKVDISSASAEIDDATAFLDHENWFLYIDINSDREDMLDDVADELARYLWGKSYKDYRDKIRLLIGVTTEDRFKKLRDRDNWHLSNEFREKIKSLFNGESKSRPVSEDEVADGEAEEEKAAKSTTLPDEVTSDDENAGAVTLSRASSERNSRNGAGIGTSSTLDGSGQANDSERKRGKASGNKKGHSSNQSGSRGDRETGKGASAGNGGNQYGRHSRAGRSKSHGIASSVNKARRNQMRSYVARDLSNDLDSENEKKAQEARQKLGEQGELEVVDDLRGKGFKVKRMPPNNKGYDIEAVNPDTGEMIYIEVKGDSFDWSDKGVGMTPSQYHFGLEKRSSFYLAVVENLRSSPRHIYYIQDPVSQITQYRFDSGWAGISSLINSVSSDDLLVSESVPDRLIKLTEVDECVALIKYCDKHSYPFPDVGTELIDDNGAIIFEDIELSWDQEKIGVLLSEEERVNASKVDDQWSFYSVDEIDDITKKLDAIFNTDMKCES